MTGALLHGFRWPLLGVVALSTMACAAPTSEDVGGTGETQDQLLAGRKVPQSEIAEHLRAAGFAESIVGTMVCTAKWESSFYERASNRNNNGTTDHGLFQINSIHLGTGACPRNPSALYDAATNAKCAYTIYKMQGLNAWYGYKAHRAECNAYRVPAGSGAASSSTEDDDGCHSGTLNTRVAEKTSVESRFDGAWYQCVNGRWSAGGGSGAGPAGACAARYPLN